MRNRCCPSTEKRHAGIAPGPRHRVRCPGTPVVESVVKEIFPGLLIDGVSQSCEATTTSWRVRLPLYGRGIRIAGATANGISLCFQWPGLLCSFSFPLFFSFRLERDKSTAPWRSHARPGLEFPLGVFEKACTGNRITRVCPRSGFPFARDGRSGNAVPGFHRSAPFLSVEPSRSHRAKAIHSN